ncbi:CRISPR-associated protein Cas4 [Haloarchaeobius sp. HRN-SO-5]|uniref:CRISPR-associated protein Cas4 n=1 Tax=Haloarchaeobius sp. HRN-SO-5 TaxID=3446118 RepID=UPI003EB92767
MLSFSDLRAATYCPRKLYYARRADDRSVPDEVTAVRVVGDRYPAILDGTMPDDELADLPVEPPPDAYRATLRRTSETCDRFDDLAAPADRDVLVTGRDCRGVVHKVLTDPPAPSLVSAGKPPENGVWEPQSVWAVAAAKALAWDRQEPVDRAFVEYPAHGVVRTVELTGRRTAAYRRAIRTVEAIDGPPSRLRNRSKCRACEYADACGVRTRTLRSLLGV